MNEYNFSYSNYGKGNFNCYICTNLCIESYGSA